MRAKHRMRGAALAAAALAGLTGLSATWASPRQASAPQAAGRVAGTVTAIAGNLLTIKDDKGGEAKIMVPDSARVLELPAGSKSLSAATPIQIHDIAIGDRILAKTIVDGANTTASTVVAMKQADIASLQQRERQEWQTKGISGLVKATDPAAQTIVVSTGNGSTARTVTVQASKTTNVRRYAPDSTRFDDAKPATLDQIKPGDQLRAKGEKSADGMELAADAIVAGTFRNIAGTVISVDPAANTVTVDDLLTKKPFVVNVNADSQLHKLSPTMAQGIAMRLKGGAAATAGGQAGGRAGTAGAPSNASEAGGAQSSSDGGQRAGAHGVGGPGQRGGDLQQMLNRAPILQLAELKKGDAVMVLTTEGQSSGGATAVTLLAGVEALLQASPGASQSVLSASWSVGGGAPGGGQDAQ